MNVEGLNEYFLKTVNSSQEKKNTVQRKSEKCCEEKMSAVKIPAEERQERIESIKKAVQEGKYNPEIYKVAEKISDYL